MLLAAALWLSSTGFDQAEEELAFARREEDTPEGRLACLVIGARRNDDSAQHSGVKTAKDLNVNRFYLLLGEASVIWSHAKKTSVLEGPLALNGVINASAEVSMHRVVDYACVCDQSDSGFSLTTCFSFKGVCPVFELWSGFHRLPGFAHRKIM